MYRGCTAAGYQIATLAGAGGFTGVLCEAFAGAVLATASNYSEGRMEISRATNSGPQASALQATIIGAPAQMAIGQTATQQIFAMAQAPVQITEMTYLVQDSTGGTAD